MLASLHMLLVLRCSDEGGEPAPSAELSAMAIALGEALMAADLPAIVAHKRRIDANLTADDELPPGPPAWHLLAP